MATSQNALGTGNIRKLLFQLALPAITAQIINVLYNVVDRMYIGHIPNTGADALTGLGVTFPIIMIISAFAQLVGMGGAPRASIFMGKGDNDAAEEVLGNCVAMQIIIAVVLTTAYFIFGDKLLMMFGASENTFGYASSYMAIYASGTIFVQIALGLNSFITAQGFAKTSMLTVLIGAVCNIILDPILIFGFNLGVQGAAIATVISQALSAIWVLKFLSGKKTVLKVRRCHLHIRWRIILPALALGLSPFIMQATESFLVLSFNFSLSKYGGDLAVGAMTILSSVMQFSTLPISGLMQGAQPIISYNFGARQMSRVKSVFKLALCCTLIYSLTFWGLVMLFPQVFAGVFTSDPALLELTSWALRIYMFGMGVFGIQLACQQTFLALGNAVTSTFLALLRKVILLIPMIFILPLFLEDKIFAVFLAEPIADILSVTTTIILFSRYFKRLLNTTPSIDNADASLTETESQ